MARLHTFSTVKLVLHIGQHTGIAPQAVCRGKIGTVDRGHVLPRQYQRHRPVPGFQRNAPRDSHFVGVAKADDDEARNRAQAGDLFDRLVCGTILAERNAVVGEHVDDVNAHQCGETDRRTHVIGEDQERRAERHGSTMRGQPVENRAHAMFAHA